MLPVSADVCGRIVSAWGRSTSARDSRNAGSERRSKSKEGRKWCHIRGRRSGMGRRPVGSNLSREKSRIYRQPELSSLRLYPCSVFEVHKDVPCALDQHAVTTQAIKEACALTAIASTHERRRRQLGRNHYTGRQMKSSTKNDKVPNDPSR